MMRNPNHQTPMSQTRNPNSSTGVSLNLAHLTDRINPYEGWPEGLSFRREVQVVSSSSSSSPPVTQRRVREVVRQTTRATQSQVRGLGLGLRLELGSGRVGGRVSRQSTLSNQCSCTGERLIRPSDPDTTSVVMSP